MRFVFFLILCIGLGICFGGIYIRKICSGILGFFWGAVLGFMIALWQAGSIYYMEDSALGVMLVCAVAVCVFSVIYEAICVVLNTFISTFLVAILILGIISEAASSDSGIFVFVAVLIAAVAAAISYVYYRYIFIFMTAFSGAVMAGVGLLGMIKGEDIAYILIGYEDVGAGIYLFSIVLCILGCIFQNRKLKSMLGKTSSNHVEGFNGEQKQNAPKPPVNINLDSVAKVLDEMNLLEVLQKEWYLLIPPVFSFLAYPILCRITYYSLPAVFSWLNAVCVGIYIGALIYLLAAYGVKISAIYAALWTVLYFIANFSSLRYMFCYDGLIYIFRYLIIWAVLLLIVKFLRNDAIKPLVMILAAIVMHNVGIEFLRWFDVYFYLNAISVLTWAAIFATVFVLFKIRLGVVIFDFSGAAEKLQQRINSASGQPNSNQPNPFSGSGFTGGSSNSFGSGSTPPKRFCIYCGAEVSPAANFCPKCGKQLKH